METINNKKSIQIQHNKTNFSFCKEQDEILNLIKQIYKGVRRFGIKKIDKTIRELNDDTPISNKLKVIDFILFKTSEKYQLRKKELLASNKRGYVAEARRLCYILFKNNLEMKQSEIASFFKRDNTLIYKALKEYKNLDSSLYPDRNFLKNYNVLDKEVKEYKQKLSST